MNSNLSNTRLGEQEGLELRRVSVRDSFAFAPREKKLFWRVSLVSVLVHMVLGFLLVKLGSEHALERTQNSASEIREHALQSKILTVDQLESLVTKSREVVQSSVAEEPAKASRAAKYLGERTQRVTHETKARQFGNLAAADLRTTQQPKLSMPADVDEARSSALKTSSLKLSRLGVGTWILPEVTKPAKKLKKGATVEKFKVSQGTHDLLGRDVALGAETLLNTDEYKYASFFNRIKSEVAPRWEPRVSARLSDRSFKLRSGFYRTETQFVVDSAGRVLDVLIHKSSGVDIFDQDARTALLSLPQLNNLPQDLREEDGLYRIRLGFVVNVQNADLKAEYVPDPRLLKKWENPN